MKILLIADLHNYDPELPKKLKIQSVDLAVTLGDIPPDTLREIRKLLPRTAFGVYGNHDEYDLKKYKVDTFTTCIHSTAIGKSGVSSVPGYKTFGKWLFAGIDGSHKYKKGELPYLSTHKESLETAKQLAYQRHYLPENKNLILFSHDKYFRTSKSQVDCGLKGVKWYIKQECPKYHFYGHYHDFKAEKIYKTNSFCIYGTTIFDTETEILTLI
jgi:predicted phosphodiesterase